MERERDIVQRNLFDQARDELSDDDLNYFYSVPRRRTYLTFRPQTQSGIFGKVLGFVTFPIRCVYSAFVTTAKFLLQFVKTDQRRITGDPLGDVMSFVGRFENKYGTEHPLFFRGSYYQAMSEARNYLRFVLVYLHSDDHQETDRFCRNVLCSPDVVGFVNRYFLFWGCSVKKHEGYLVSRALGETSYPFLAVIVLRSNRMTMIARLEGPTDTPTLIERLEDIMRENEHYLELVKEERLQREVNQVIRQQQDAAYLESLQADQEKEKKRREKQEQLAREELNERNKIIEAQQRREELQRQKIEFVDRIPAEPPLNNPDTIRLSLKLSSGMRLERRFNKNDSMKSLFYFVFCHDASPENFQIVTNFPIRVVPCQPSDSNPDPPTFAQFGFGSSEVCFIQDLES